MVAVKRPPLSLPTRSDFDWRAAKALKSLAGFVFVCNRSTLPDPDRGLFGLPAHYQESVRAIRRGMPLFLFNSSTRCLSGVFEAASDGGFNIDPYAWNANSMRSGQYSNPVSKYPAQVRVYMRVERPPLEEDIFGPILDYFDGNKFRLELNAHQVQQLFCLFDASDHPHEREHMEERSRGSLNCTAIGAQDPESPRSAFGSDSDGYGECSSRGANSGEDEWMDQAPNKNGMHRESVQTCGGNLSERLRYIALDNLQNSSNELYERELCKEMLYSAVLVSGVPAAPNDTLSDLSDCNGRQMAWEGNSRKAVHCPRSETFHAMNDSSMLLRLQDIDPAVNSNSIDCFQAGVHQPLAVKRQGNVGMPMPPSQVQSPFPSGENMIYIPLQTVHRQQRGVGHLPVQPQRSKWGDQRKSSRGWSAPNPKKQSFNRDKVNKPKDVRYHKQHLVSENQQPPPIQSQRLQAGQVLVPLCTQTPGSLQEQGQLTTLLSPVFMSPNGQGLTFAQPPPQIGAGSEDSDEGYETVNDAHLHPDGLQNLLQNGHFPILVMPSIMPRIPAGPSPGFVEALHCDILHFARLTRPTMETQLHAEAAIDCVREGVKMVWPGADVEVFGSFATGLCLQHSDVDLAVVGAPQPPSSDSLSIAKVSACLVRELASALEMYEWCESINVLDTASMPVLKCHCRPRVPSLDSSISMPSIAIDITIGGMKNSDIVWNKEAGVTETADQVPRTGKFGTRHTGGAAREYVLHNIRSLPALAPLVLLLKSFLHHKGLSNVYSGGLGSFSLTLLLAFYLERMPMTREVFWDWMSGDSPVSPTASSPVSCTSEFLEDSDIPCSRSSGGLNSRHSADFSTCSLGEYYVRRAADVVERVLALWDSDGSPLLGTLLLGFLRTFGFELDLSSEKIVLKGMNGSPGGIFKRDNRHVALWIDDPLRPGVNIGAGSFGMFHVQAAFREMLQVLTNCELMASPPQCTEKGCRDLAAMGHLSQLSRLVMEADDYE